MRRCDRTRCDLEHPKDCQSHIPRRQFANAGIKLAGERVKGEERGGTSDTFHHQGFNSFCDQVAVATWSQNHTRGGAGEGRGRKGPPST